MKTLFIIFTLLSVTSAAFAQYGGDSDELMRKSRKARTTSTILVATGPVIAAGGIGTLVYGLVSKDEGYIGINGGYVYANNKNYNAEIIVGSAAALVGIGMALTSIHFSRKASDLKREARRTKLKTSTENISIPGLQNGFVNNRSRQFKLSLVIPL